MATTTTTPPTSHRAHMQTRKGVTAANAWQCPACPPGRHWCEQWEPACRHCGTFRDDLDEASQMLALALEPDDEASDAWRRHWQRGAGDDLLAGTAAVILASQPLDTVGTDHGPLCWEIVDRKPRIWLGEESPAQRLPDFDVDSVAPALRRIFNIGPVKPPGKRTKKTTTEPEPKPQATAPGLQPGSDGQQLPAGSRLDVPLDRVDPSPFQPRTVFDDDSLRQLGESIRHHGQTADCLVRQIGERFELIGGERRFRACQLAGIETLAVKVIHADDRKARELAVFDNLDREDLTAIDRIRAYRGLIESGVYATQKELAETIGIKPASLSNMLRILDLPDVWLEKISQEKLPLTHARHLVPWKDRPAVLDAVRSDIEDSWDGWDNIRSVDDFRRRIDRAIRHNSRPCSGDHFWQRPGENWSSHDKVRLTKKDLQREDLDVVDVNGMGKRAFNVELWDQLQLAGWERSQKRQTKTAAAEKTGKREDQTAKKLWMYLIGWQQQQIADQVENAKPTEDERDLKRILGLLLWFCEHGTGELPVADAMHQAGPVKPHNGNDISGILCADPPQLWEAARLAVTDWLQQNPFSYHAGIRPDHIAELAGLFAIDLKRHWRLDRTFLELLTKDQLGQLVEEWKLGRDRTWKDSMPTKRTEIIDAILAASAARPRSKPLPPPKALTTAKKPANFYV